MTLVVDEFHTLPGADYEQVLGELAKYGANVMLATQTLARLDRLTDAQRTRDLRASVFSNLDGLFAFHTSAEDAALPRRGAGRRARCTGPARVRSLPVYARVTDVRTGERLPTFSVSWIRRPKAMHRWPSASPELRRNAMAVMRWMWNSTSSPPWSASVVHVGRQRVTRALRSRQRYPGPDPSRRDRGHRIRSSRCMTGPSTRVRRLHVGPSSREALQLLSCCPRLPTSVVNVLLGHRQAASTSQLLTRLRRGGMVRHETGRPGPLLGSRPLRLWSLTNTGRAFVASLCTAPTVESLELAVCGQHERTRETTRQPDLPLLLACYRLLAETVLLALDHGADRPPRIRFWEHPWIRTIPPTAHSRRRHMRLPAAAVIERRSPAEGSLLSGLLLLLDLGTAPLASYRFTLQALLELQCGVGGTPGHAPTLIIGVAVSPALAQGRVQAWHRLLADIASRNGEAPPPARVLTFDAGTSRLRATREHPAAGQIDELFALLARHPLLTRHQLASLLHTTSARIARL